MNATWSDAQVDASETLTITRQIAQIEPGGGYFCHGDRIPRCIDVSRDSL